MMITERPAESLVARLPSAWPRVGIARHGGDYRLVALEPIQPGQPVIAVDGVYVDVPSRYSVQVGPDAHVEPPAAVLPDLDVERYRWRFLNHACEPNSAFQATDMVAPVLVALAPIAPWEEITFNYNTTEFDMADPFVCRCGHCGGRLVRGFRWLGTDERARLEPLLAAHLRAVVAPTVTRVEAAPTIPA